MAGDQSIARENFRRLAALRGWTAKEVAVKIGISEGALYNWTLKSSPTNLGSGSLVRLARLFNIEPEDFLGTEGLADLDEESVTIDETRESLLEELRGLIDGIEDEGDLIYIGDILKGAMRAAKDHHDRERLNRRRQKLGPLPRPGDAKG